LAQDGTEVIFPRLIRDLQAEALTPYANHQRFLCNESWGSDKGGARAMSCQSQNQKKVLDQDFRLGVGWVCLVAWASNKYRHLELVCLMDVATMPRLD